MNNTEKRLFEDVPVNERTNSLKAVADTISNEPVTRQFEESELTEMRVELGNVSIIQDEKKILLAEETKKAKDEIKLMETKRKSLMANIRTKSFTKNEEVYGVANQEGGVMEFYDAEGIFLYSRRLTPGEKQTHIRQMQATK